jgi:hypothetical protein
MWCPVPELERDERGIEPRLQRKGGMTSPDRASDSYDTGSSIEVYQSKLQKF